jgi:hypothetical protein
MKYEEFSKRLKEMTGLQSLKLDIVYHESDSRCWTALIGEGTNNILVTFHINRGDFGDKNFDILASRRQLIEVPVSEIFELLSTLSPVVSDLN